MHLPSDMMSAHLDRCVSLCVRVRVREGGELERDRELERELEE